MLIYGDLEFTGLHQQTTPISIGLISEDGKQFYAEFSDYDLSQVDDWIQQNVVERLKFQAPSEGEDEAYIATRHHDNPVGQDLYVSYSVEMRGDQRQVGRELLRWLAQFPSVEWVFDVGHYDFVLLIDLLAGKALDLPIWVSPCYHELNQDIAQYFKCDSFIAFEFSRERLLQLLEVEIEEKDKHNALYDAKVARAIHQALKNKKKDNA